MGTCRKGGRSIRATCARVLLCTHVNAVSVSGCIERTAPLKLARNTATVLPFALPYISTPSPSRVLILPSNLVASPFVPEDLHLVPLTCFGVIPLGLFSSPSWDFSLSFSFLLYSLCSSLNDFIWFLYSPWLTMVSQFASKSAYCLSGFVSCPTLLHAHMKTHF